MANQDKIRALLKQAVDAARDGKNNQAVVLLHEVTDLDEQNERAWYLLATLTDDPQEKRIYLENVLYANPHNERAQEMLNALTTQKPKASSGISSRTQLFLSVGALVVFLIVEASLVGVGFNRRSNATATAVSIAATSRQQELIINETAAAEATENTGATATAIREATAIIETQTATAGPSNTPTFDPTNLTPPPTWTPSPAAGGAVAANPSDSNEDGNAEASAYPPPPADLFTDNFIMAWGGFDDNSNGLSQLRRYDLDNSGEFTVITGNEQADGSGRLETNGVSVNPSSGQHMIYLVEFEDATTGLERATIAGRQTQLVNVLWRAQERILNASQPLHSFDGSQLVFTGEGGGSATREVWLVDFDAAISSTGTVLQQITNDTAEYSSPTISPDNSQIVVVRADPDSGNEPDLYLVDVATGEQTALTQDGFGLTERQVTFSPDGQTVIYSAAEGNDPGAPGDLIQLNLSSGSARPVLRTIDIDERNPVFSLDGRYLAYASDETGPYNIYIRDLQSGDTFQVSNEALDPVFPGSWYQPGVVAPRPLLETLPES